MDNIRFLETHQIAQITFFSNAEEVEASPIGKWNSTLRKIVFCAHHQKNFDEEKGQGKKSVSSQRSEKRFHR